ncbi:MAG: aminoglycoside phosphotransferase family protein [Bacilli bacterium]|nr:aminoglycoside phosphotransferase family protein [Bacilli bacterium]
MQLQSELEKTINAIFEIHSLGRVKYYTQLNIGYNRIVICVNDELVLKICTNSSKVDGIRREVQFYKENQNDFHPQLIASDLSGQQIPFIYTIEQKIQGQNLFDIWANLNQNQRESVLYQLLAIIKKIHSYSYDKNEAESSLEDEFEKGLSKVTNSGILIKSKVEYLNTLKEYIQHHFVNARYGMVHGDIHYNNIIFSNGEVKIVDFECYKAAPLDKEFDSLARMVRSPNGLLRQEYQKLVNPSDYQGIMPFFRDNYPEVCSLENFDERILVYDCINSLKWYVTYPNHKPYNDILFEKSKTLIR